MPLYTSIEPELKQTVPHTTHMAEAITTFGNHLADTLRDLGPQNDPTGTDFYEKTAQARKQLEAPIAKYFKHVFIMFLLTLDQRSTNERGIKDIRRHLEHRLRPQTNTPEISFAAQLDMSDSELQKLISDNSSEPEPEQRPSLDPRNLIVATSPTAHLEYLTRNQDGGQDSQPSIETLNFSFLEAMLYFHFTRQVLSQLMEKQLVSYQSIDQATIPSKPVAPEEVGTIDAAKITSEWALTSSEKIFSRLLELETTSLDFIRSDRSKDVLVKNYHQKITRTGHFFAAAANNARLLLDFKATTNNNML